MPASKPNIGIAFGGVAPEHEVSIISSLQAAHALLGRGGYEVVPLYVAKDGAWYTGDDLLDTEAYKDLDALRRQAVPLALETGTRGALHLVEAGARTFFGGRPRRYRIDVVLPGFHGGAGEDGSFQGLCEAFGVPYTGSAVLGSAIGMDKVHSKLLCRAEGVPVVNFAWLREADWAHHEEQWLDRLEDELGYPVVVKPARLGSSIGIAKAAGRDALDAAIEDALRYDEKVVVERAVQKLREINCAVLGDPQEAEASVLEEPVAAGEDAPLSFQDKYMREGRGGGNGAKAPGAGAPGGRRPAPRRSGAKGGGGGPGGMASLDRVIPADLPEARTREIQRLGVRVFQLFECAGVARIDFMIDEATGDLFFNEINTIPGSFSFYLWDPPGVPDAALARERVPFGELLHRMIEGARRRHRQQGGRVRSYDVNLLAAGSLEGLKGAKRGG